MVTVVMGWAGLQIPGYPQPWEDSSFEYPSTMASPLDIEVQGSNGASGPPFAAGYMRRGTGGSLLAVGN